MSNHGTASAARKLALEEILREVDEIERKAFAWSGSAFLNNELEGAEDADCKTELYKELCGIGNTMHWLRTKICTLSSPEPSTGRVVAMEKEEFAIDKLRFRAFHTNSDADRQAYFDAVSKWFQDRHYRHMDAERALSSPDHADAGKVEGDGWQPIESAPKDGTLILAWNYNSGMQVVGWQPAYGSHPFDEDHWDDVGSKNAAPSIFVNARHFTHWRPLPTAPASEGSE